MVELQHENIHLWWNPTRATKATANLSTSHGIDQFAATTDHVIVNETLSNFDRIVDRML